jgi:hypothetical protein
MGWKTGPYQFFYENHKNQKMVSFWYKIQFLKFEGGNENRSVFPFYQSVFDGFFIQNSKFE